MAVDRAPARDADGVMDRASVKGVVRAGAVVKAEVRGTAVVEVKAGVMA